MLDCVFIRRYWLDCKILIKIWVFKNGFFDFVLYLCFKSNIMIMIKLKVYFEIIWFTIFCFLIIIKEIIDYIIINSLIIIR